MAESRPFHLLQAGLAESEIMDRIRTVINERVHFILQVKKLFFGQIRTFKHRFLHPAAETFQGLHHPVTSPVVTDIVTDKIKHLYHTPFTG